ncbi:uncharacterized abhydrolase domain-containing protein DDB_G0269086-like, partial [Mizuhopecten yessoensis]|uniref:uncharacterized abhydrolase domain-containing protein DDB_G0269086-like n=1 Tax=Mizuhopecten yessoensis TaxID=6573 RepID=UPI000B45A1E8
MFISHQHRDPPKPRGRELLATELLEFQQVPAPRQELQYKPEPRQSGLHYLQHGAYRPKPQPVNELEREALAQLFGIPALTNQCITVFHYAKRHLEGSENKMPTGTGDGETADAAQELSAAQSKVEIRKLELQAEVEKEKIQLEREKLQREAEAEREKLQSEAEAEREKLQIEKHRLEREAEREKVEAELELRMMELEVKKLKLENKTNSSVPCRILEKAMAGEAEIQRNIVDHVVNMRERLAEIRDTARETLVIKRQKIKQWYDQNATQRELRPGDEVLLLLPSDSSKMVAQWKGPITSYG